MAFYMGHLILARLRRCVIKDVCLVYSKHGKHEPAKLTATIQKYLRISSKKICSIVKSKYIRIVLRFYGAVKNNEA